MDNLADLSGAHHQSIATFAEQLDTDLLVVVFTDLVGSTSLKAELGDQRGWKLERLHRQLLYAALDLIDPAQRQAIRVEGDSYLFVFRKPADAVRFALHAQVLHGCERAEAAGDKRLLPEFRVGIHLGTVIRQKVDSVRDDLTGVQVDTAARIMSLAQGGQVLCSEAVHADAELALKGQTIPLVPSGRWQNHGKFMLKGRDHPLEIWEVVGGDTGFRRPRGNEKAWPVETASPLVADRETSRVPESVDQLADRFESAWNQGRQPQIADYLKHAAAEERAAALRELVLIDLEYRWQAGQQPALADYLAAFPELVRPDGTPDAELAAQAGRIAARHGAALAGDRPPSDKDTERPIRPAAEVALADEEVPPRIGRYATRRPIGAGAFGRVLLCHDEQLDRLVAVKVPHRQRTSEADQVERFLAEARMLARLDHPAVVPVYDFGRTDEGHCFVVCKYIEGCDLHQRAEQGRLPVREAVELVATIAAALHYAHLHGVIHRDVKPSNILLDREGRPYVGDFGLALSDEQFGKGPNLAGTPAYMSPEQARGEGHLVDGRSDVFSLGVVLYELLAGRRPFGGDTWREVLQRVKSLEPRPLRQIDDTLPRELDRICLQALAKRITDRYPTMADLAGDLRGWLRQPSATASAQSLLDVSRSGELAAVVPKGLRAFDAEDADFFLSLLPGPRDRFGLPDSVRFWIRHLDETESPDRTFRVGLMYGPSGCGKTSLMKAGVLPRLSQDVAPVYVEATPADMEARLVARLRNQFPELPPDLTLVEAITLIRRDRSVTGGRKLVLVLDQFEQWLHANRDEMESGLVHALRQCDGSRVQCVVMVRDDFWMAATHFLRELELSLLEGQNSKAVDLFDLRHARKVLTAFGRAFGYLPAEGEPLSDEQNRFVQRAVDHLAEEGRVVPVRLAVFAEMVKDSPWSATTLKDVGGPVGVGVLFLERMFRSPTAPPAHRYHLKAVQGVLQALLPDIGTQIKARRCSRNELIEAAGYGKRPQEVEPLLQVLDHELRLLTPIDPEPSPTEGDTAPASSDQRYYQLTHDYLVPSVRDWLERIQFETRKGRVERRLVQRTQLWTADPERKQLPTLWEWLAIRLYTRRACWNEKQKKMMRSANRYYTLAIATVLLLATLLGLAGYGARTSLRQQERIHRAESLAERLAASDIGHVPDVLAEIGDYQREAEPVLRRAAQSRAADPSARLRIALALLKFDTEPLEYVSARLLDCSPEDFAVVRDALSPHREELLPGLWNVAEQTGGEPDRRFHAACALATYDPEGVRWQGHTEFVARQLASIANSRDLRCWTDALRPIGRQLISPLREIYRDASGELQREQNVAAGTLADFGKDDVPLLADLLLEANERQFPWVFSELEKHGPVAVQLLAAELERPLPAGNLSAGTQSARRQANAAAALLLLKQPPAVWPLLAAREDPSVAGHLLRLVRPLQVDPQLFAERLAVEPDPAVRRNLLLALAEFPAADLAAKLQPPLQEQALALFETDPQPGVHAAARWLLQRISGGHPPEPFGGEQQAAIKRAVKALYSKDGDSRGEPDLSPAWAAPESHAAPAEVTAAVIRRLQAHDADPLFDPLQGPRQWFVTAHGNTLLVVNRPTRLAMGSSQPETDEEQPVHEVLVPRSYAISATEVTLAEFLPFLRHVLESRQQGVDVLPRINPPELPALETKHLQFPDQPVCFVSWYVAAAYCNWRTRQEFGEDQVCFEETRDEKQNVTGLSVTADTLRRTGYRLPTEAEWEYACRAGTTTSRYFGTGDELLADYAVYLGNSGPLQTTLPVGSKRPNPLGLFDAYGNLLEWCLEIDPGCSPAETTGPVVDRLYRPGPVQAEESRPLRGGGFYHAANRQRSAFRQTLVPSGAYPTTGFRLARTLAADASE